MNALYCYKPILNVWSGEHIHYKPLNDNFWELARLSVKSSKKYYRTVFYTDEITAKQFNEHDIVFDEVIIHDKLKDYNGLNYSLPKIYAMMDQKDPYISLDFDSVLTMKPNLIQPITFGFYDADFTKPFSLNELDWVRSSYMDPYTNNISKYYDIDFNRDVDWRKYPNFSFLGVKEPDLVRKCYEDFLSRVPLEVINETPPTTTEQFILYQYLLFNGIWCDSLMDVYQANMVITEDNYNKVPYHHVNINMNIIEENIKTLKKMV